jgi:hypothetical protein
LGRREMKEKGGEKQGKEKESDERQDGVEGEEREGKTGKHEVRQRSEIILMRLNFYFNT